MLKLVFLGVLIFTFFQTPFYKKIVVGQYYKFEDGLSILLYSKPQDTKPKIAPPTDSVPGPVIRRRTQLPLPETNLESFMPKKARGGVGILEPQVPYQKFKE